MAETIQFAFIAATAKYRDKCLFRFFDGSWQSMSYGDFFSLAGSYMSLLREYGLHKGDRIAVIAENRPEWCASYIAAVGLGCIAVPVDIQLGGDEIRNLLMDSEAKVAFCSNKTESALLTAIQGTAVKEVNFDTEAMLLLRRRSPSAPQTVPDFSPAHAAPDDIASIIYTSGTTGNPKGVMLTHRNFFSDAEALVGLNVVSHDDNVLSILPLHHTYPFMCTFLLPLFLGATITFGPGLKAPELISAIKENSVTVLVGVPRLFEMLRNGIMFRIGEKRMLSGLLKGLLRLSGSLRRRFDLNIGRTVFASVHRNFPKIKFFASGGARLDPEVMGDLEALGFTVLEGYGLTETSPVITFNPVRKRKPGAAGVPLPCVEIKIMDDGEITAKGPMVMKGYYKNEEATAETIKEGRLFTGDLGYVDEDGYVFITGRKKEVIILGSGKNVYPEDVEKAYMGIRLIKEICVMADERGGTVDAVRAVIVPDVEYAKQHSIGNINDGLGWKINEVSVRLPEYMRIRGYTLSSEPLPRTPLGKLGRFMVLEVFRRQVPEHRAMMEEDRNLMEDPVGRKVAKCIRPLIDEGAIIHLSDNFELDLGFDSLDKVELMASLEGMFGVALPETFISQIHTVRDLVHALKSYELLGASGTDGIRASWRSILEKEPSVEDADKIGYSPNLVELAFIFICFMKLKLFCKILFRLKVEGSGNIPAEGPFVLTPNHTSYLDGFIVAASVPFSTFRKLYFLGTQEFFTGGIKSWFARMSHVIPIDADIYLNKALQLSSYVLRSGRSLCIFPEGGRSFDGSIMPFKKGIGVLAREMQVPVVPVYIEGAYSALPRGAFMIRPVPVRVVYGEKILSSGAPSKVTAADLDEYQIFADHLRESISRLAPHK
ncbi:MAG: AMP-binding protein [Nitrospirae bacterium]|nr:AMP-binding protein [Nitrospirota bacterium]